MSLLDNLKAKLAPAKDKVSDLAQQHGDKVTHGLDKAAKVVDEKTKGKYSEKTLQTGTARPRAPWTDSRTRNPTAPRRRRTCPPPPPTPYGHTSAHIGGRPRSTSGSRPSAVSGGRCIRATLSGPPCPADRIEARLLSAGGLLGRSPRTARTTRTWLGPWDSQAQDSQGLGDRPRGPGRHEVPHPVRRPRAAGPRPDPRPRPRPRGPARGPAPRPSVRTPARRPAPSGPPRPPYPAPARPPRRSPPRVRRDSRVP